MPDVDPNAAACGEGMFGLDTNPQEAGVILVPVPFDATTSYRPGAARGPEAIRQASHQIDLHDREVGDPWRAGIALLDPRPEIVSHGTIARQLVEELRESPDDDKLARVNQLCAEVNQLVAAEVSQWLREGRLVGTIGGDHATALGSIQAHAGHFGEFGILHIDAHADLRRDFEGFTCSHASIMEAVCRDLPEVTRLVQVGVRDFCEEEARRIQDANGRIVTFFDADMNERLFTGATWAAIVAEIIEVLPQRVYISFDIDGLDPKLCPHTGTPVPGGLSFPRACHLLRAVARSGRHIIGFDLVEVAPGPDGDEWDGNVGARLLYKLIGVALQSMPDAPH